MKGRSEEESDLNEIKYLTISNLSVYVNIDFNEAL